MQSACFLCSPAGLSVDKALIFLYSCTDKSFFAKSSPPPSFRAAWKASSIRPLRFVLGSFLLPPLNLKTLKSYFGSKLDWGGIVSKFCPTLLFQTNEISPKIPPNLAWWSTSLCRLIPKLDFLLLVKGQQVRQDNSSTHRGRLTTPARRPGCSLSIRRLAAPFNCFVLWADAKGHRLISITCNSPPKYPRWSAPKERRIENDQKKEKTSSRGSSTPQLWDETMG